MVGNRVGERNHVFPILTVNCQQAGEHGFLASRHTVAKNDQWSHQEYLCPVPIVCAHSMCHLSI